MISESILLVWFSNLLAELLDFRHISLVVKYPTWSERDSLRLWSLVSFELSTIEFLFSKWISYYPNKGPELPVHIAYHCMTLVDDSTVGTFGRLVSTLSNHQIPFPK